MVLETVQNVTADFCQLFFQRLLLLVRPWCKLPFVQVMGKCNSCEEKLPHTTGCKLKCLNLGQASGLGNLKASALPQINWQMPWVIIYWDKKILSVNNIQRREISGPTAVRWCGSGCSFSRWQSWQLADHCGRSISLAQQHHRASNVHICSTTHTDIYMQTQIQTQ